MIMPSFRDNYQLMSEHQIGYLPIPWPLHLVNPQMHSDSWFPIENFASLPPKPFKGFHRSRPARRFSDPGPVVPDPPISEPRMFAPNDDWIHSETQRFSDEARKDRLFANLLQELRTARDLNRQLCLELHKANMKLHLAQQHSNNHQPGSMAALVRKLYEAHHVRSEILSNWNCKSSSDSFPTRKSSFTSTKFDAEDIEDSLLKERETLLSRLQSTDKKIHRLRNSQWHGATTENSFCTGHNSDQRSPLSSSRCMGDVITFNKVSRSHSFAMTSPSTSDPPSLEDLDIAKQYDGNSSTKSAMSHLLVSTTNRPTYVPNSNVLIHPATAAAAVTAPSLKRDIELQLATLERDRRQLEHQLQDSIGTRRLSEDRVVKLERLVSVLRKKLEVQTAIQNNSSSSNCSVLPPSPTDSSSHHHHRITPNANYTDYASLAASGRTSQLSTEGPSSLPSYLQVVGPITQL